jgi:branched-chain amino acid transport system substrate-binding protein
MRKHSAIMRTGVAATIVMIAAATAAHAQDKVIKIGGLFAMSGPGSYFGVQDKQGIDLAIEQLNKNGVNGHRF